MKKMLTATVLAGALVLLPLLAAGQTAQVGQVAGEVTDTTGAKLPGVVVTLASEERGISRQTVSDATGKYIFALVPPGHYDVIMALPGFATRKLQGNLVESEKTTTVSAALPVATVEVATTVTGEVPVVDATNQTVQTRLRVEEFERMPYGRSYQTLIGAAPGIVGTGNVNSHGAVTNSNIFLFDGVNTTDPTTGTFGANLNYEAIQEVVIRTSGVSAEFGRGTGAVVDVITKSGTNRFAGSFKYLAANDQWNSQNTVKSEVDNTDLKRTKFDHVNSIYSTTIGGPALKNRLWFFLAHEQRKNTSAETQLNARPGITPETFQQTTTEPFFNLRVTDQVAPNHNVWLKVVRSPTDGFVRNDYWSPPPAERYSLTGQDQSGMTVSGQYTGVYGTRLTAEAMVGHVSNNIQVYPFSRSPLSNGAPYVDFNDGRIYNGATFDGFVDRPRNQATGAATYYTRTGSVTHAFKAGVDWQGTDSTAQYAYPNNQIFNGTGFDPATRKFTTNDSREDYDEPEQSRSKGYQTGIYFRDRLQMSRVSAELGLRIEHESGKSDIGVPTVDTTSFEPRASASFSLTPDGKTLGVVSYGRFHDAVLMTFSDSFANVPQQTNYSTYIWNGSSYEFSSRSTSDANNFIPNTDITPRHMDEFTVGFERQLSRVLGVTSRYIHREWGNFIDDVESFNLDGTLHRVVQNITTGRRNYRGLELTMEKRLANNWSASGSYTYSRTRGNHIDTGSGFTLLEDFTDASCRQTVDPGLFNRNPFPCSELQGNYYGAPTFDRPHLIKFNGTYLRPLGPVNLTAGAVGSAISKTTFQKQRTVSVLSPDTGEQFSTMTYYYEPRGSERVPGMLFVADLAVQVDFRTFERSAVGVKFDIFNVANNQEKVSVNNLNWCNSTATAACQTTVNNFGKATARTAFQSPRTYRLTALFRF